jgi:hypothetical protein
MLEEKTESFGRHKKDGRGRSRLEAGFIVRGRDKVLRMTAAF